MPRSYKICDLQEIKAEKFVKQPFDFNMQPVLDGVEKPPTTSIYVSNDAINLEDFNKYLVEHEVEVSVTGRISGKSFNVFIRKGFIDCFVSSKRGLVLLSGKKKDVLDFCRIGSTDKEFRFKTLEIDMKKLLVLLPNVKGVWFAFNQGQIKASALMGSHVESTGDFKEFEKVGEISTLTFSFEFMNEIHPVMVTEDAAVILQGVYPERAFELALVLEVKSRLLDQIIVRQQ